MEIVIRPFSLSRAPLTTLLAMARMRRRNCEQLPATGSGWSLGARSRRDLRYVVGGTRPSGVPPAHKLLTVRSNRSVVPEAG